MENRIFIRNDFYIEDYFTN